MGYHDQVYGSFNDREEDKAKAGFSLMCESCRATAYSDCLLMCPNYKNRRDPYQESTRYPCKHCGSPPLMSCAPLCSNRKNRVALRSSASQHVSAFIRSFGRIKLEQNVAIEKMYQVVSSSRIHFIEIRSESTADITVNVHAANEVYDLGNIHFWPKKVHSRTFSFQVPSFFDKTLNPSMMFSIILTNHDQFDAYAFLQLKGVRML